MIQIQTKAVRSGTAVASLLYLLLNAGIKAQINATYDSLIQKAYAHYRELKYKEAGMLFSKAFWSIGDKGKVDDRITAAACWTQIGKDDSAFLQLEKIVTRAKYTDDFALSVNVELKRLQTDSRWESMMKQVRNNKQAYFSRLPYPDIAGKMDSVFTEDQLDRMRLNTLEQKYGTSSEQVKAIWREIDRKDSLNLLFAESIIQKYGWLGKQDIGERAALTLFLVIQHAKELAVQEKYLPLIRTAAGQGKLELWNLAILEDRVLIRQGKNQKYGSQLGVDSASGKRYILPIDDAANVNKRRAEMGMEPLEVYAERYGILLKKENT